MKSLPVALPYDGKEETRSGVLGRLTASVLEGLCSRRSLQVVGTRTNRPADPPEAFTPMIGRSACPPSHPPNDLETSASEEIAGGFCMRRDLSRLSPGTAWRCLNELLGFPGEGYCFASALENAAGSPAFGAEWKSS